MTKQEKVFHSPVDNHDSIREKVDIIFVRPENSQNVGAAMRAIANMGVKGRISIIGLPNIINDASRIMARHAVEKLTQITFFSSLSDALSDYSRSETLVLAATARTGSVYRPHPICVDDAMRMAVNKVRSGSVKNLVLIFGPESDGLVNEEIGLCDWVVTIPSSEEYRSLNLAQAVLIFVYEINRNLLVEKLRVELKLIAEKEGLKRRFLAMAEIVGFILPGDPMKMRPRLERMVSLISPGTEEIRTIHGLIEQVIHTVQKGKVEYKRKFKHLVEQVGSRSLSE